MPAIFCRLPAFNPPAPEAGLSLKVSREFDVASVDAAEAYSFFGPSLFLRVGVSHMQLGRVIGNVVCSIKNDSLEGKKLLLVQPIDRRRKDIGKVIVAVDSVGAGAGEVIYWCRGREASFPWYPDQEVPTEASIVGIVDEIHIGE